jgi:uncharacterized protein YjbI with pentapeptide repeats
MKLWELKDLNGKTIYETRDPKIKNRRSFINSLIAKKVSFENADLSEYDLSNLTLSNLNFTNANLHKADLRGVFAESTIFLNANLEKSRLEGGNFSSANFDGADLSHSDMDGIKALYTTFRGATFFRTNFTNVIGRTTSFNHANIKYSSFKESTLINSDFSNAIIYHCDFTKTNLSQNIFKNLPNKSLDYLLKYTPNRTDKTIVVGCKYDNTQLDDSVQVFEKDKNHFRLTKKINWFLSTSSLVFTSDLIYDRLKDDISNIDLSHIEHILGLTSSGTSVVAVFSGLAILSFLKDTLTEKFRDKTEKYIDNISEKIKLFLLELNEYNTQTKDFITLVGKRKNLYRVHDILLATQPEAKKKGFFSKIKYIFSGSQDVIFCDKKHFSLAMSTLSNYRDHKFKIHDDILLIREKIKDDGFPQSVTLKVDGTCNILWYHKNNKYVYNFDKEGNLNKIFNEKNEEVSHPIYGVPNYASQKSSSIFMFEEGILSDLDINFSYPRETHYVQHGKNGSLFVKKKSNKRIDNPGGNPAIIIPELDKMFFAKDGKLNSEHINPILKIIPTPKNNSVTMENACLSLNKI